MTQHFSFAVLIALLLTLLAACSSPGGIASSSTPTATPSPTPSPTPALTAYTGDGFTFSYPKDWTKSVSDGQTIVQDAPGTNVLTVGTIANANGIVTPGAILKVTLASAAKEANMTGTSPANVPASVSLAGETWMQGGTRGTMNKSGVSAPFEFVVLATNHPANTPKTRLFEIIYGGQLEGSTLVDEQIFQAMLTSFKFTS